MLSVSIDISDYESTSISTTQWLLLQMWRLPFRIVVKSEMRTSLWEDCAREEISAAQNEILDDNQSINFEKQQHYQWYDDNVIWQVDMPIS